MPNGITKFIALVAIIVATVGLLSSSSDPLMEQLVKAQNMTTNMTESTGNMTGTDNASGAISGIRG